VTCTKREESKIQATEMKFLTAIMERPKGTKPEMHASVKSSGWQIYRTELRKTDCDSSDMSKE
jgi:hypothetical protein